MSCLNFKVQLHRKDYNMNISYLEEAVDICRRASDSEGLNRSKREAYDALASKIRLLVNTIEEQSSIFNDMISISEETHNYELCEAMQELRNHLNHEFELLEELKRSCNYVANI